MIPKFSQTLWSNPERSRFFLIPDERELASGNFVLRTVTGRQREVDETELESFEVSRDEAKVWLKEQFGQMLTSAKGGIMDALKNWRSSQPVSPSHSDPDRDNPDAKTTTTESRTAAALSELDVFLNQSAEQVRAKSAKSLGHLQAIANALNAMFEGAISAEPGSLEQAQRQAQVLRDNLEALGIQADNQLENLPERLHRLYFAEGQAENFEDNAAQLDAIADRIEHTATLAVRSIRAMAQQQRHQVQQNK